MGDDRNRSVGPGQWAPWISDPDPPMAEEPMTEEEMAAAAKAAKAYMDAHPVPPSSKRLPYQTVEEREAELMEEILRNHPGLTREEAQEMLDSFF
jgi:hypothetical protein